MVRRIWQQPPACISPDRLVETRVKTFDVMSIRNWETLSIQLKLWTAQEETTSLGYTNKGSDWVGDRVHVVYLLGDRNNVIS